MQKLQYEEIYNDNTLNIIKKEFSRLKDIAYLDHTGATLYSEAQARAICNDLCGNIYGNPHALNSSSKLSSDVVDHVRERILSHFKTDSTKYDVIFTSGATAALKLVAETFPWEENGSFIYLSENHTSVLGMRELAAKNKAKIYSLTKFEADKILSKKEKKLNLDSGKCIFAYPAQCNFSGVKYPLDWIENVQNGALGNSGRMCVMLDAASYVATSQLDLSQVQPEFVCISFYKMFGLPTGLGALLVSKNSGDLLKNDYFGGGTVLMAMSGERKHISRRQLHERFEAGTISFLSIAALRHGFDSLTQMIPGGIRDIESHTFRLARYLHHSLAQLQHANGVPVVVLYCDTDFEDQNKQGPILNFNIVRANGSFIGFSEVLNMCNLFNIHVRTGCFCNPGACQRHLNLSEEELKEHFEAGHVCGDSIDLIAGKPTGSIRVSLGYCSTLQDIQKLLELIKKCFVQSSMTEKGESLKSVTSRTGEMKLSHIFLYPIKSCGAQNVLSWPVDTRGFEGDRAWMIATDAGIALTQKHEPRMCLIKPFLDLKRGTLTLSFPEMEDMSIPYKQQQENEEESPALSKVCGARVQTSDCGDKVAQWLSLALEKSGLRLLRQWHSDERTQKKSTTGLSLANQAQFLLVGLESLAWLETRVLERQQESGQNDDVIACEGEELLSRFRSNLVVTGASEFEETKWKAIKIGSLILKAEGPCTRCQMVCISQSTGNKTTEPLRTLTAACEGRMQFGAYFSHSGQGDHKLYVGSPIKPIQLTHEAVSS